MTTLPSVATKLLGGPAICRRLGICRHTWLRWNKAGHAPAPVPNVPGHPRWRAQDIDDFERGAFKTSRYFRTAHRIAS